MTQAEVTGLRERHREGRRQRILLAAADLFRNFGFEETSVDAIASRAEVSVPTIYSYFAANSDLLLGLLEEDKRLMQASLAQLLRKLPHDSPEAVVAIAQACIEQGYTSHFGGRYPRPRSRRHPSAERIS
jgi:AcrR family transcriptional regulator